VAAGGGWDRGGQPLSTDSVDGIANRQNRGLRTDDVPDGGLHGEFKVQTNGMSAEFGRTSARDQHDFKGRHEPDSRQLFEFLRNDKLNANDFFANKAGRARTPSRVNQFGGTVGGPVVKDKLFYFFNYEGYRERTSSLQTITSPTDAQRSAFLRPEGQAAGQLIAIFDPTTRSRSGQRRKLRAQPFAGTSFHQPASTRSPPTSEYYPKPITRPERESHS